VAACQVLKPQISVAASGILRDLRLNPGGLRGRGVAAAVAQLMPACLEKLFWGPRGKARLCIGETP
jgi:hypothetical protein